MDILFSGECNKSNTTLVTAQSRPCWCASAAQTHRIGQFMLQRPSYEWQRDEGVLSLSCRWNKFRLGCPQQHACLASAITMALVQERHWEHCLSTAEATPWKTRHCYLNHIARGLPAESLQKTEEQNYIFWEPFQWLKYRLGFPWNGREEYLISFPVRMFCAGSWYVLSWHLDLAYPAHGRSVRAW